MMGVLAAFMQQVKGGFCGVNATTAAPMDGRRIFAVLTGEPAIDYS